MAFSFYPVFKDAEPSGRGMRNAIHTCGLSQEGGMRLGLRDGNLDLLRTVP
jgi:hypothetical protein